MMKTPFTKNVENNFLIYFYLLKKRHEESFNQKFKK